MRVKAESRYLKKTVSMKGRGNTVKDLLDKLGLISENYVVTRGRHLILSGDMLRDGDTVKLIAVIKGG
jgi:sulfur carrier protein ThiS